MTDPIAPTSPSTSTSPSATASATKPGATTSGNSADVGLRDKLSRCVYQLGDWESCPSGKTPEGQKIIQNLKSQISTLETRIAQSSDASSQTTKSQVPQSSLLSTLGSRLNIYA